MGEPEYVFKKGEGWVIRETPKHPYIDFTFACGTRCRMIDRNPEVGERFRSASLDSEFEQNGHAELKYWSEYISDLKFESCHTHKSTHVLDLYTKYVTVIPL